MSTQEQQSVQEALGKALARIKELEAAQKRPQASGGMKVSEKGALSVYGLGRFPVTLYASQWETLFAKTDEIKKFMESNRSLLKSKDAVGQ